MSSFFTKYEWPGLLLLLILGVSVYSNTAEVPFYFDDMRVIEKNPNIRLSEMGTEGSVDTGLKVGASNRPVAMLTFAFNYYFSETDVKGYHKLNILIHILTGIILYFLIKNTLNLALSDSEPDRNSWIALFSALLWLAHPLQTQSVTYIVQRMTSMAAMFYVLSVLLYVKGRLVKERLRRAAWFVGAAVSGTLALGSKQIAATLPLFILLYEWYFFQELSTARFRRHLLYMAGAIIVVLFLVFQQFGLHPLDAIFSGYDNIDYGFTLPQRVLTEFRVVIFYISLLLYPHPSRLNLDHDFPLSYSLLNPMTTLLSLLGILGLVCWAICRAKKDRLLSFCILWFFGNLVIESSVINLELIYEHRLYMPSMFFCLGTVVLVYRYVRPNWAIAGVLCGVILLFSVWTYQRNNVWRDPVVLWKDCATKSKNKARPHYNAANALHRKGRSREAVDYYTRALQIRPNYEVAHANLATVLAQLGRLQEAIEQYSEALLINPALADTHYNLGNTLARQGRIDDAIAHYHETLKLQPGHSAAQEALNVSLALQGRSKGAAYPDYPEATSRMADEAHNKGLALARQGRQKEAVAHFLEAVRLKPNFGVAHNNLGLTFARLGKLEDAVHHYRQAIWSGLSNPLLHHNFGLALAQQGKLQEAVQQYLEALRLNPDLAKAHNNLGKALASQGKLQEAVDHFSEAVRLKPDYADAQNNLTKALKMSGGSN